MSNIANENLRHIEAIRDDLKAIYEGRVYRLEDGEEITLEEGEELTEEQEEGAEAVTFFDYFADALDIIYYTRGREEGDILGARVMVTCGGPNIYVDTYRNTIELYWWSDRAECELWHEVADAITEALQEAYYC